MQNSDLHNFDSPTIRQEIEMRIEIWNEILGSGLPEEYLERARVAGYKVPKPRGFTITPKVSPGFNAVTGSVADPYFEFTISITFSLRILSILMISSNNILVGLHEGSLNPAKPPFPQQSDWRAARELVRRFSEKNFHAFDRVLEKIGMSSQSDRQHLAITLSMQIELFIVFHELGHHRMGHIKYINIYSDIGKIPRLLRHVFELEADRNAISTMFNGFYEDNPLSDTAKISSEMQNLRSMPFESRWRLWTTMVGLLFLTLEIADPGTCLPGERFFPPWKFKSADTHPPPLYRLKHAVVWAGELIEQKDNSMMDPYRRAVRSAQADIEILARNLGILDPLRYFKQDTYWYEEKLGIERNKVADKMMPILIENARNEVE